LTDPPKSTRAAPADSKHHIVADGLWYNNPGLVQLLGLCPLLAISNTLINGLSLGLATLATLLVSNTLVSAGRRWIAPEIRIPVYVLIIATTVTVIELILRAWFHELYQVLGIFIPLIVTNCMIIGRAESFASRHGVFRTAVDAAALGAGFLWVLTVLGGIRELIGHGSLLRDAQFLFGDNARHWVIAAGEHYQGMLIALLPPGAFILLGLLLVAKNLVDARLSRTRTLSQLQPQGER